MAFQAGRQTRCAPVHHRTATYFARVMFYFSRLYGFAARFAVKGVSPFSGFQLAVRYELILPEIHEAESEADSVSSAFSCKQCVSSVCSKAKELAIMPTNAAMLLGIVVGVCPPIRSLFIANGSVDGSGEGAPLGFITDTLWALGFGANPCLMLLLGASLGGTARSVRSQRRNASPLPHTSSFVDVREAAQNEQEVVSAHTAGSEAQLTGIKRVMAAVMTCKWLLMPLLHVFMVLGADSIGGFVSPMTDNAALRFVVLIEGALPPSMTVLAIAVSSGNKEVERLMGLVLVVQYLICPITLTISSAIFLTMI